MRLDKRADSDRLTLCLLKIYESKFRCIKVGRVDCAPRGFLGSKPMFQDLPSHSDKSHPSLVLFAQHLIQRRRKKDQHAAYWQRTYEHRRNDLNWGMEGEPTK